MTSELQEEHRFSDALLGQTAERSSESAVYSCTRCAAEWAVDLTYTEETGWDYAAAAADDCPSCGWSGSRDAE